jgi:hypothetical protein
MADIFNGDTIVETIMALLIVLAIAVIVSGVRI